MKAKKIVIPIVCIAVAAAAGVGIYAATQAALPAAFTEASLVEKKDSLMNYISVTGTVESQNCSKVYSTLSYPVEKINFEVGDRVNKGDVLCTLNTDSLRNQILQQQAAVDSSSVNANYQLTQAEKNYNDALEEYNSGRNQGIISAEQALAQAESALEKAQNDYDNAVEMAGKDKNTQLKSAELSLKNAKDDLKTAEANYNKVKKEADDEDYYSIRDLKKTMDDAKKVLEKTFFYDEEKEARKAYDEAKTAYDKAKNEIDKAHSTSLEAAENSVNAAKKSIESAEIQIQSIKDNTGDGVKAYKSALSTAQMSYENAKENLSLAKKAAEANLSALRSAAERERTVSGLNDSGLIALESLKEQLDEAVITSPSDGIITFVGASEGGEVTRGTLFTVEDSENLKVTANLREYDVANVTTGMRVIINSDAASEEYEGVLTKIAPTAAKGADGSDAGTALFAVEIAVTSKNTALRIGMTAKMRIVIEEKENVLTVPYDCISADKDGNDVLYIAEKSDTGYSVKIVPVTVGMETDFYSEISGEGITENTIVINDTSLITEGQTVLIDEAELGLAPSESEKTE